MVGWRPLLFLLMMLLCSETAVFAACEGLTGKPAAECLLGTIESEGHLSPDAFGENQVLVPQYQGTPGCAEGGCYRNKKCRVVAGQSWKSKDAHN